MTAPAATTVTPTTPRPTVSSARGFAGAGRTWSLVHLGTLLAGIPVLAWIDRDQWFTGDEWAVVIYNGLGANPARVSIFAPHFEHWTTLVVLVYKAIYSVVALRSYVPYLVMLIIVLLVLAHLTWRLLLRVGVAPPYATAVAALTLVLAVGWENRAHPWQVAILAPVALGFGALLLMPERGPWQRRDAGVAGLLLLGVACSGVGVTMTVVVALAALLRRGWRVTLAIVAVPAAVYGAWYVLEGTSGQRNKVALSDAARDLPDFVWRGITAAYSGLVRVPDTGALVLAALVVWMVWRARPRREPWPIVVATTVGALVSISLTGLRRSGDGSFPEASRYSDVVVLLSLPALALATQEAGRALIRRTGRVAVTVCGIVVVAFLVVQAVALDHKARTEPFAGHMKPRVLAVARVMRDHEPIASTNIFGIPYISEPSTKTIARFDRHGELPALDVSLADVLTAREYVETLIGGSSPYSEGVARVASVGGASSTRGAPGCVVITPSTPQSRPSVVVDVPTAGTFRVASNRDDTASLSLVHGRAHGEPREFPIGPAAVPIGTSRATRMQVALPGGTTSTVCGLSPEAGGSS
jgi:hypothetical protein